MRDVVAGVGYIGAPLCQQLLAAGREVIGIDNFFSIEPLQIASLERDPRFRFIKGSINSPATIRQVFACGSIDTLYFLAAQASAHPDAAPARYTEATNLLAPRIWFEQALQHGVRQVVYGSSMRVYGAEYGPQNTEHSCYGACYDLSHLSKIYVEQLLTMFAARGLNAASARLGLVYGLGMVMKSDYRFLTAPNRFCLQAVRGESLRVDRSGLKPQPLLHVLDAASALRQLAEDDQATGHRFINTFSEFHSIAAVARMVAEAADRRGMRVAVECPLPDSAGPAAAPPPSSLLAARFLPQRLLNNSLGEVIDYYHARGFSK